MLSIVGVTSLQRPRLLLCNVALIKPVFDVIEPKGIEMAGPHGLQHVLNFFVMERRPQG